MAEKKEKKKKEKVTYVDDGRSLADMSSVQGGMKWTKTGTHSSLREIWGTYWSATKMMFMPMLVVIGFIIVIYLLLTIIFTIM